MKKDRSIGLQQELEYFRNKMLDSISQWKQTMNYEPLKITFYLSSPISLNFPWMFFDSLVGWVLFVKALGQDYYLLPRLLPLSGMLSRIKFPPHPIKRQGDLFHSSASVLDAERTAIERMYKKFEDRWAGGRKKVSKGSGYFKDYMIQHIYIPASKVEFYVNADGEEMERICHVVQGLGDNSRIGWGAIKDFRIESVMEDWSIVKNDVAMRPIPVEMLEYASEQFPMSWKPPYWDRDNVAMCAPPGASVRVKAGS